MEMTGHCEVMVPDAEGQRPIDSSKILEREKCDQMHSVSVDRMLPVSSQLITTRARGILTGASGQHDQSVWSPHRGT